MSVDRLRRAVGGLRHGAEVVLAAMLGVMFFAFVVQIVFRYFFNYPTGWTTELTVAMWLWMVLWGAALVVKESEEIRIDLVTAVLGRRGRMACAALAGVALVVLYGVALPYSWSYVSFMKVEKSSYLKIPMNWMYSIFILFLVAAIIRYLWLLVRLARGKDLAAPDPSVTTSAL